MGGRQCRAAVLWGGRSAGAGMFDARAEPRLWASSEQRRLHEALSALCPDASAIQISEIVLTLGERNFAVYRKPEALAGPPAPPRQVRRLRSHYRFRNRATQYVSESNIKWIK